MAEDVPKSKPPEKRRYSGLFKGDGEMFSRLVPHTMTYFTIEDTPYRVRPHRVILWGEFKGEPRPFREILATDKDIQNMYQILKNRIEDMKNGNEKTDS